jgi:hypothetical protein
MMKLSINADCCHAEYHLCFILSVANKPIMLSVITLNDILFSVVAPYKVSISKAFKTHNLWP